MPSSPNHFLVFLKAPWYHLPSGPGGRCDDIFRTILIFGLAVAALDAWDAPGLPADDADGGPGLTWVLTATGGGFEGPVGRGGGGDIEELVPGNGFLIVSPPVGSGFLA